MTRAKISAELHLGRLSLRIPRLRAPLNATIGLLVLHHLPLPEPVHPLELLDQLLAFGIHLLFWCGIIIHYAYVIKNNMK